MSFLELSTIEVLLMSVICSQGIPIFNNDWENLVNGENKHIEECTINWLTIVGILKLTTEQWLSISKAKLSITLNNLYCKHYRSQILIGIILFLSSVILLHICAEVLTMISFKTKVEYLPLLDASELLKHSFVALPYV